MSEFAAEFIGTMILVLLGDGVVANVCLKGTKGCNAGWIVITMGWGLGVFTAVMVSEPIQRRPPQSGGDDRPGGGRELCRGQDPPVSRRPVPRRCGRRTCSSGCSTRTITTSAPTRARSSAPSPPARPFAIPSATSCPKSSAPSSCSLAVLYAAGPKITLTGGEVKVGLGSLGAIPVAFVVIGIGLSLGGTTGYAINPARDLGPRLVHFLVPIPNKGTSDWGYSWVPIVGPILGALLAAFVYSCGPRP